MVGIKEVTTVKISAYQSHDHKDILLYSIFFSKCCYKIIFNALDIHQTFIEPVLRFLTNFRDFILIIYILSYYPQSMKIAIINFEKSFGHFAITNEQN